jgi:hypothetical protein
VVVAVACLVVGCSGNEDSGPGAAGSAGAPSGGSSGTGGSAGADAGSAGSSGMGGSAGGSGGREEPQGGDGGTAGTGITFPPGDPGCGLEAAAFCDNFDARSSNRGRAGELDSALWSGSRMQPDSPTLGGNQAFGVRAATLRPARTVDGVEARLPACRTDLPETVFPDDDALICDPSSDIESNHLLVAVTSQNYGQNSYRVRQPFDFAGRTGTIVFDAEAVNGGLLGWVSLAITEDPIGAPSFQSQQNLEGGVLPPTGLSIQLNQGCTGVPDSIAVAEIHVYENFVESIIPNPAVTCVPTAWGKLNHFEISISEDHLEVRGTPFSPDGTSFGALTTLWSSDVSLPFSRGYVQINTHNHATLKYASEGGLGMGFNNLDAWIARWDNVGFDGPIITSTREYEIGDSLVPGTIPDGDANDEARSIGFVLNDEAKGPGPVLEFEDVDLDGVTRARVAMNAWYCLGCVSAEAVAGFTVRYRFNGGDWIDRPLSAGEVANLTGGKARGAVAHLLDVALDDLVPGKNTLELMAVDIPQNYAPAIANVDLVLETD